MLSGKAVNPKAPDFKYSVFWHETEPVSRRPPLSGAVNCDVCIVGGGYTGLWSAYFLSRAEPSLKIHILEADYAGAGASGHNDGFMTKAIGGHSQQTLARRFGPQRAADAHSAVARSAVAIYRFCRYYGIAADLEPAGYYAVATTAHQRKRLAASRLIDAGDGGSAATRSPVLDGPEIRQKIGSPNIVSGCWIGGILLNPHKLVRGLARVVEEEGTVLHELSPVIEFDEGPGTVQVRTSGGCVTARHLILATDAWQGQFPPFRGKMIPAWNYALVTAPLSGQQLADIGIPGREGFIEICQPSVFGRLTADNRLLLGGGSSYNFGKSIRFSPRDTNPHKIGIGARHAEQFLFRELGRYFPMLTGLPVTHFYGGAISVTAERLPSVGKISPRITYGHGYNGNGIAVSFAIGKLICDTALGNTSDEWLAVFRRPGTGAGPSSGLKLAAVKSRLILSSMSSR
jgi:glycine/D-amino acid oxidase-like deaminating enzyme